MRYQNCKVYKKGDSEKKTLAIIEVESESPLYFSFEFIDGIISEGTRQEVTTDTDFVFSAGQYNLIVPGYNQDFKITSFHGIQQNEATWNPKFRWRLTLEG